MVDWHGHLTIVPPIDNWIVTSYLPEVFNTVNNTVTVIQWFAPPPEPPPSPTPPQPPAPTTTNVAVNNSLWDPNSLEQTIFVVPNEFITQAGNGAVSFRPEWDLAEITVWAGNQWSEGNTWTRAPGEGASGLSLTRL